LLLKRFNEFIKINEEKKDDGIHVDGDRLKIINKRKKSINQKWVCLIVTDKTKLDFEIKYPGRPFDINLGSHRIFFNIKDPKNTKLEIEEVKNKYKEGNIYNKNENDMIIQVNFHQYSPLID